MNPQDTIKNDDQTSAIKDLPVKQDDTAAIKGGPIFPHYRGIDGEAIDNGSYKQISLN